MNILVKQIDTGKFASEMFFFENRLGKREYHYELKCLHMNAEADKAEASVWCPDCKNSDLSDDDREELLEI